MQAGDEVHVVRVEGQRVVQARHLVGVVVGVVDERHVDVRLVGGEVLRAVRLGLSREPGTYHPAGGCCW